MTLNDIFDSCCLKFENLPSVGMAMEKALTYGEFNYCVFSLAERMRIDGVRKGDRVAILGENSPHWGIAYFAIVRLGAVAVPILPGFPEENIHQILKEMKTVVLFITELQIKKIHELKDTLTGLIITLDDYAGEKGVFEVQKFTKYMKKAVAARKEQKQSVSSTDITEEDLASIIYTSGTTGFSKAVMLSHGNLASSACATSTLCELTPGDTFLSFLPLSHLYEFTCGFMVPFLKGCRIAYADQPPSPAILQKLCLFEKPSVILTVPLVFEKIYKNKILPKIKESRLLSFLCKIGFGRRLVYKMIGARLLDFFGDNLKILAIGGAALNPDVEKFLFEAKFPYLIGYGMTEAGPMIACGPFRDPTIFPYSTGKPLPGVQIKINDSDPASGIGEIVVRGPNVMQGYCNDIEKTKQSITENGWLLTGDIGFMDRSGNLHIKGRSKNVIVLANGENVYPEGIENIINMYPWVIESLIIERNGKIEAWVYPDYEYFNEQTIDQSQGKRDTYLAERMEQMRLEINRQIPKASRIVKVFKRQDPFVKTATHKIKRDFNTHL